MTRLLSSPIQIEDWIQQCKHPDIGAMELFIGLTRNSAEDNGIIALEYEAYEEMVEKESERLERQLKEKYPLIQEILVIHRIGKVPVSEPSLLVILTGIHRNSLFQAMEDYIYLIKQTLPIWKKGIYKDGHEQWLTNPH